MVNTHRHRIAGIALRCGISNIRIFGSAVREGSVPDDLDLLVTVEPGRSLLDFVAFSQDVGELLGMRIDVVSDKAISPYMRDRILSEAVPL